MSGAIHAPRNSFNKRSFGRDLSNLQQVDGGIAIEVGNVKQSLANISKKVYSFHLI